MFVGLLSNIFLPKFLTPMFISTTKVLQKLSKSIPSDYTALVAGSLETYNSGVFDEMIDQLDGDNLKTLAMFYSREMEACSGSYTARNIDKLGQELEAIGVIPVTDSTIDLENALHGLYKSIVEARQAKADATALLTEFLTKEIPMVEVLPAFDDIQTTPFVGFDHIEAKFEPLVVVKTPKVKKIKRKKIKVVFTKCFELIKVKRLGKRQIKVINQDKPQNIYVDNTYFIIKRSRERAVLTNAPFIETMEIKQTLVDLKNERLEREKVKQAQLELKQPKTSLNGLKISQGGITALAGLGLSFFAFGLSAISKK